MTLSGWCILIAGPVTVGGIAALLAYHKRSWTDVVFGGIFLCVAAWLLNLAIPPVGAILLVGYFGIACIFTLISSWRD